MQLSSCAAHPSSWPSPLEGEKELCGTALATNNKFPRYGYYKQLYIFINRRHPQDIGRVTGLSCLHCLVKPLPYAFRR
jgi:hypothetical protein